MCYIFSNAELTGEGGLLNFLIAGYLTLILIITCRIYLLKVARLLLRCLRESRGWVVFVPSSKSETLRMNFGNLDVQCMTLKKKIHSLELAKESRQQMHVWFWSCTCGATSNFTRKRRLHCFPDGRSRHLTLRAFGIVI